MIHLLHISDLHLVVNPLWNNMKKAILYSVRESLRDVPIGQKLLVITGDFHNFEECNFQQASDFLPSLFEAMEIDPTEDVFVIPGNHDISKMIPEEIDREALISAIKHEPNMLYNRIERLLSCYDGYLKLIKDLKIYKHDCSTRPVEVHIRTWRDKLKLLHLNTTLIADGKSKKDQMVDIFTATSDPIRQEFENDELPRIAIGHNSFFDLTENQKKSLKAMFLQEYISAYLCGDRHQKNSVWEENLIHLEGRISSVKIPNIVSYRTSTDENDTYSDFGMIWHIWDEKSGDVHLEYMKWDPDDQGKLQPDGEDGYSFLKIPRKKTDMNPIPCQDRDEIWFSNLGLSKKGTATVRQSHIRNFLLGGRCTWGLAFSSKQIVRRDIVNKLSQCALEGGIYALTGPGGEGKTTALMQLCAILVQKKVPTFYYRGYGLIKLPEDIPEDSIFVLDNPPDTLAFKHFLDSVIDEGLTLILGVRKNEWNLLKQNLGLSNRDIREIPMEKLTTKEAWSFAECVCKNLRCFKDKEEIKEIFQTNSYGFLYAAMLLAVNNTDSLDEIAGQIIDNLSNRSPEGLCLLAHIVMSEHYGVKFSRIQFRDVCKGLNITAKDGNFALSREAFLNGEVYQTRHEVISRLFYRELFSDSGVLSLEEIGEVLTDLLDFQLKNYQRAYGRFAKVTLDAIICLCKGLDRTSVETQEYLINRLLDEFKGWPPQHFFQLPSCMKDEELQLLFYRKCFERDWISSSFLLKWCSLLQQKGASWNISEPYSPAWIMRSACMDKNGDGNIWLLWAHMEAKQNGAGNYTILNTARWIYREACLNHGANSNVWLGWAQLEAREKNVGNCETENTARWIYREACFNHGADSNVWLGWAQLEAREKNVGNCETENTARWIYREACLNHNVDGDVWLGWAQLEAREKNVGDYETENTARWIYREACLNHGADGKVWLGWAQLETNENNVGNLETPNTVRWILTEGIKHFPNHAAIYSLYSYIEISQQYATKARTILRQSLQYSDFLIGKLAILEFCYGNIDSDNRYCTRRLMDRMESQKEESFRAIIYLYHCALLLKQEEKAEQYHQLLLQNPNYNPNNKRVNSWIQLCTEAVMLEKI